MLRHRTEPRLNSFALSWRVSSFGIVAAKYSNIKVYDSKHVSNTATIIAVGGTAVKPQVRRPERCHACTGMNAKTSN